MHTGFCWGDRRKRVYLEDLGVDGKVLLKWVFETWGRKVWTGLMWLRAGTVGGHL